MVGVPALDRCVCGPSLRTTCPAFRSASFWISVGPNSSDIASAVSAAMMVRKVMYWNRCKAVKCRAIQSASSSIIGCALPCFLLVSKGRDDLIHAGGARALDQARDTAVQLLRKRG